MSRFGKQVAAPAAAGFLLLCLGQGLAQTQSTPAISAPTPHMVSPANRSRQDSRTEDIFGGLTFTEDQQAKINQIHQEMKSKMDVVARDEKLNTDQKGAMIDGLGRMERQQIYKILTPEQQSEVRKKAAAIRAAQKPKNGSYPGPWAK